MEVKAAREEELVAKEETNGETNRLDRVVLTNEDVQACEDV